MRYKVSGIANITVDADDKREAMAKARETNQQVVWIEAEEEGEKENDDVGR